MQSTIEEYLERAGVFVETPAGQVTVAIVVLVYAFASCRVFAKAGFHGATGLLMLLPPFMLFLPLFLAFGPWPVRRELRSMRRVHRFSRAA